MGVASFFLALYVAGAAEADPCAEGVSRQGSLAVVTRQCADEARRDNTIVLSKVAIKARLDKKGRLRGYEAVEIDKGSAVERMGFMPHDLLTSVNGIPARDLNTRRRSLESADRFDITILRKGRAQKIRLEIR
jgi:S1-C subfamily serine protease